MRISDWSSDVCSSDLEYYPKPGAARAVQIEIDPKRLGLPSPCEAGLVGDSRSVLRELLPLVRRNENRDFLAEARQGAGAWRDLMEERGTRADLPMKPQVVTHELNKLLDDDAIIVTDSGTITTWVARHIDMRGTMRSEEHTSELQSLMRISYAVFCLKQK